MTYIQAFDKIKEKLDGKAKISQDYDSFAIQVTLTNKDSHGIFYLKYSDGFLDVQPYDYFDNDAAVSLSYQTFLKLTDGRLSLDDALSKGLAEIYGNRSAAAAICGIVPQDKAKKATPKTPKETKPTAKAKKSEPKAETKTQKMAKTSETSASAKSTEVKTPSKAVKPLASTAEKKKNVPSGSVKASAASKAKATRNATDKKSEKPVSKSKK